jgi:hypothetical protein
MMHKNRLIRWLPGLVLLSLTAVALAAGSPRLARQVTAAGGNQLVNSGISLQGTVGQVAVGIDHSAAGDIDLQSGYWQPGGSVSAAPIQEIPERAAIYGNAPNPFNPMTEISYSVGKTAQPVRMRIYDIQGRLVRTLVDQIAQPGVHQAVWQGRNDQGGHVSSGMYFCRLQVGAQSFTHKMMLLK